MLYCNIHSIVLEPNLQYLWDIPVQFFPYLALECHLTTLANPYFLKHLTCFHCCAYFNYFQKNLTYLLLNQHTKYRGIETKRKNHFLHNAYPTAQIVVMFSAWYGKIHGGELDTAYLCSSYKPGWVLLQCLLLESY